MEHRISDSNNQGATVAVFKYPDGWQAQSQVIWNYQATSNPVQVYAATFNPKGQESLEFFPTESFYWLQPNYGFNTIGQQQRGLTFFPPVSAEEVMTRWLIPKYRSQTQNLRIVAVQPINNLAQTLRAFELQNVATQGVMAKIQYSEQGQVFEEEFYACRYEFPPTYGQSTQQNWGMARVFSFRARLGQLEQIKQTFWHIATSIYYNPQWQEFLHQVCARLNGQHQAHIQAGYDKLRSEQQFQQQLLGYYQSQRDQQNASVARSIDQQNKINGQRSNSNYTAQDARGDALMGRTAYEDPNSAHGNYHYDHGHHEVVWTDGQGNYIPTNDVNYDPNINSNQTWYRAQKAR